MNKFSIKYFTLIILLYVLEVHSLGGKGTSTEIKQSVPVPVPAVTPLAVPSSVSSTTTRRPFLPGVRLPCACASGQCGCCSGYVLDRFNQKACLNLTYEPDDFALSLRMSLNGRVLYKNSVSGKNPPPVCIPVPRIPVVRFCVRFYNVYFASRNIHLCVDMAANWDEVTLVNWSLNCVRMGASGVAVVGPEEGGGVPVNPIDAEDQTDEDYDDSARIVPFVHGSKVETNFRPSNLIFNSNIRNILSKKPSKSWLIIEELSSGDRLVSFNEKYTNNKTIIS